MTERLVCHQLSRIYFSVLVKQFIMTESHTGISRFQSYGQVCKVLFCPRISSMNAVMLMKYCLASWALHRNSDVVEKQTKGGVHCSRQVMIPIFQVQFYIDICSCENKADSVTGLHIFTEHVYSILKMYKRPAASFSSI